MANNAVKVKYARLQEQYNNQIRQELKEELSLKSVMQAPKIEKIVLNCGVGEATKNPKLIDGVVDEFRLITGQAPVKTLSRKAIAGFKLRENLVIGVKVTLRSKIMYEFLDRLINIALPRVRDFQGLSPKSFDKFGNYSFGIKEQIIFPEITFDKVDRIHGLDVIINIKSQNPEHSKVLLEKFNFPFKKVR